MSPLFFWALALDPELVGFANPPHSGPDGTRFAAQWCRSVRIEKTTYEEPAGRFDRRFQGREAHGDLTEFCHKCSDICVISHF